MIFNLLSRLLTPAHLKDKANQDYASAVAAARQPVFYTDYAVPDSVDGRFDMITLHVFLRLHTLEKSSQRDDARVAQLLIEAMCKDMDRSLREMGVGDMSVGKKVQKMAYAINGRLQTYRESWDDEQAFAQALWRNLYRSDEALKEQASALAAYVKGLW